MGNASSEEEFVDSDDGSKGGKQKSKAKLAVRSAGDGMEIPAKGTTNITQRKDSGEPATLPSKASPHSLMCKIPVGALTKQQAYAIFGQDDPREVGQTPLYKEPKFIPYEPYRAATRPMVPEMMKTSARRHKKSQLSSVPSVTRPSVPDAGAYGRMRSESSEAEAVTLSPLEEAATLDMILGELEGLRQDKKELEGQLEIQTQVNAELKNLLVASVGEDMESRVQFLTEDKARLGKTIDAYYTSLTAENEEKDKFFLECERWKSKFLAASLMVSDLARWKAALSLHSLEAKSALSQLLTECAETQRNLAVTLERLKGIPCDRHISSESVVEGEVLTKNVPQIARKSLNFVALSEDLRNMFSDASAQQVYSTNENKDHSKSDTAILESLGTEGSKRALEVLNNFPDPGTSDITDNITRHLCCSAFPYIKNGGVHSELGARYENLTLSCCEQCEGKEIQLL